MGPRYIKHKCALALILLSASVGAGGIDAAKADSRLTRVIGARLFERVWVPAPSSTSTNAGLGPLFNARSCAACHQNLDRMPLALSHDGEVLSQHMVLRLSDRLGAPDPTYGSQLQVSAVPGHRPEGSLVKRDGRFAPSGLSSGALADSTRWGARDAPMLRGLGLLEEVADELILALEDPEDRDGDGVRGRANRLPDGSIGKFGSKASTATLESQVALAFLLDLGMSTTRHSRSEGDCTAAQVECRQGSHGGDLSLDSQTPEVRDEIVAMVAAYVASLAPPTTTVSTDGLDVFTSVGCATCHRPAFTSRTGRSVPAFTDLLLHDLGPELDGGATEPGVASTEWRTAPLWGLSRTLQRGGGLLHDGRARSVEEAISFHGGEASSARSRFNALPQAERQRLVDYVGSL